MTTLKILPAILLSVAAGAAAAADLVDIYRQAQLQDPVYASARAAWVANQEKLPQGRALLLPSATLSANTSYNNRDIRFRNDTSSLGQFNNNGVTLSVTQPLFRMQNRVQYEEAKTQVAQADAQLSVAIQDLASRVAQAYFDVLLAQDNLDLAGAQKAAIGEQLAQAKRNFEVGTATITDTHDAQARYDLTTSQEIAARNDLEIKKRALQQITGTAAPPLSALGPRFALTLPEPNDMNAWVLQAMANSQQVAIQRATVEFAEQEVARNRYGHFPTIDAVASYGQNATGSGLQGGIGNDTTNKIIGLQFALPLYQGGAVNSLVRQAIANLEKARQDLEATARQVTLATQQAFLGVANGLAQVRALEAALISSQSSLDSSRLGQEVGVRTQVDVLNAQQQLYTARFNLAQAKYNYILNQFKLEAAVGQLGEEDLLRVNQWLGP
jgi:outer membrane protein